MIDSLSLAVHAFASVEILFGWWDAASNVSELVHEFQRTTI